MITYNLSRFAVLAKKLSGMALRRLLLRRLELKETIFLLCISFKDNKFFKIPSIVIRIHNIFQFIKMLELHYHVCVVHTIRNHYSET